MLEGRWLVSQRWDNLLFAHWAVDPDAVARHFPGGVEPDTRDGVAWVAIVAFVMVGTRLPEAPTWAGLAPIPELNVRTYVRVGGEPAVWFLSLDASSRLFATVGHHLYGLRYRVARMAVEADGSRVHYLSARPGAAFAATYAPSGPPVRATAGSLEHFLVERYRLFAERRGRLVTATVVHEPWPLQPATARIELNRMAPPGIELEGEPLLHFVRSVHALISAPEPVRLVSHSRRPAKTHAVRAA
jgi:uncharacterized protein YqjF (DUF2071 family)